MAQDLLAQIKYEHQTNGIRAPSVMLVQPLSCACNRDRGMLRYDPRCVPGLFSL